MALAGDLRIKHITNAISQNAMFSKRMHIAAIELPEQWQFHRITTILYMQVGMLLNP